MKIIKLDDARAKEIEKAIYKNGGYCPCQFPKSEDTICICKDFREQTEPGACHCGLYQRTAE